MASNALTNLRGRDPGANRQTDAISRLVEPVAKAVMATPIMGAKPPAWIQADIGALFAPLAGGVFPAPRYHRDVLGYVHVQGCLLTALGAAAFSQVLVLPIGYRPGFRIVLCAESSSAFASVHLFSNGRLENVQAIAPGGSLNFCFSFLAEQ